MARKPTSVLFVCGRCSKIARPGRIRKWDGLCASCRKEVTWTIIVEYTEEETTNTAFGIFSSLLIGVGWKRTIYHTNTLESANVPTDVVRFLTSERRLVTSRAVQYAGLRQRQEIRKNNAIDCSHCGASFVPGENVWNTKGYCSRLCAAKAGSFADNLDSDAAPCTAASIDVQCPNGHKFSVLSSFSGVRRPCPFCGEKTAIP